MGEKLTPDMQIGSYAPGNYMCRCHSCDRLFTGDKRALTCFDCAKEQAATARTLELVAEWFDDLAEHAALAESTEERRQAAIALRSTAFAAWLEDRS